MTIYQVHKQWSKRWFPWVTDKPEIDAVFDTEEDAYQYIASCNTAFEYKVVPKEIKC